MLQINGEVVPFREGLTVLELLDAQGFRADRVAVERNGEILSRSAFSDVTLMDGDRLEIVQFVGGG